MLQPSIVAQIIPLMPIVNERNILNNILVIAVSVIGRMSFFTKALEFKSVDITPI